MPRMKTIARPQAAASAPKNDEVPHDIHELRLELARSISGLIANEEGAWRWCRQTVCRRARACQTPQADCPALSPPPEMSEAEEAGMRAEFGRMLRKRRDELARQADDFDQQS